MHRRDVLRMVSALAAAPALSAARLAPAHATEDGTHLRAAWLPVGTAPVLTSPIQTKLLQDPPGPAERQRMFPTLLPAGSMISGALDAWYLWLWTHDTSRLYLYTAPTPQGPYTFRHASSMPLLDDAVYDAKHVSSGDIVWDPAGNRFISNPHSVRRAMVPGNGEVSQDSFLIQSSDGISWNWLRADRQPSLVCGPPQSPDSIHTGYGRLLRDLDGHLAKFQNRYWWLYRAQRRDADLPVENPLPDEEGNLSNATYYAPGLASAATLDASPWDKHPPPWTTDTANTGQFDVGSFIRAAKIHHAVGAMGTAFTFPTRPYWNRAVLDDSMTFAPTAVPFPMLTPDGSNGLAGGANIVRDPATRRQYAVVVSSDAVQGVYEVWLFRGVPD